MVEPLLFGLLASMPLLGPVLDPALDPALDPVRDPLLMPAEPRVPDCSLESVEERGDWVMLEGPDDMLEPLLVDESEVVAPDFLCFACFFVLVAFVVPL